MRCAIKRVVVSQEAAAIVELRFNDRHDVTPYRGEVEFIPREQWEEEKRLMREAVEAAEAKGEWKGGRPPPESPEYVNWLKLRAVSAEMEESLFNTSSVLEARVHDSKTKRNDENFVSYYDRRKQIKDQEDVSFPSASEESSEEEEDSYKSILLS